jgi:hypothetical protein
MKIGFIFESGRDGADCQVCRHFLSRLEPEIEMVPRFMDDKKNLLENCGPVAAILVESCERVVILWDLYPAWRERHIKPCRKEDRSKIFTSLRSSRVPPEKVALVCIEEELEAWLLADIRALRYVLAVRKRPHPVGKLSQFKNPDRIRNPKTRLTKLFNQELGAHRRYIDYQDAIRIAQAVPDFSRIRRSSTFSRFTEKTTGRKL